MAVTASQLPNGKQQFLDSNGKPLAGGSVYMYIPATTSFKTTWQDNQQATPNTNPITLDGAGEAIIYGSGQYRQIVYDAAGNLIWDQLTQDLLSLFNLPATTRTRLSANQTYYVSNSGNDTTGNGTSGSPWATIQKAVNYVATTIDCSNFAVTIQLADGTYAGVLNAAPFMGTDARTITITGNTSTPSNVVVNNGSGGSAFYAVNDNAGFAVSYLKIVSAGGGIAADQLANITVGTGVVFGACAGSHISATNNAFITLAGNYSITGGGYSHYSAVGGGEIVAGGTTAVTVSGTPAFTTFAQVTKGGLLGFSGITFTGSATGTRFTVSQNGTVDDGSAGLTALPGNATGTFTLGGVYGSYAASSLGMTQQTFTASGTYTPVANLQYAKIQIVGGGGGGGGTSSANSCAGAGGSGAYIEGIFSAATLGASQAITIGAGGAGGTNTGGTGGTGGTTSVGSLLAANGGFGGIVAGGSLAEPFIGIGGQGSPATSVSGAIASQVILGQQGGMSLCVFDGSHATQIVCGSGGSTPLGSGGFGASNMAGTVNGGGGGGALVSPTAGARGGGGGGSGLTAGATAGVAGGNGVVIITEYYAI